MRCSSTASAKINDKGFRQAAMPPDPDKVAQIDEGGPMHMGHH